MEAIQHNRRPILLGLVVLVMLCMVGVLIFNVFFRGGSDVVDNPSPVATEEPTIEATEEIIVEEPTATPTLVIVEDENNTEDTEEVTTETDSGTEDDTAEVVAETEEDAEESDVEEASSPDSGAAMINEEMTTSTETTIVISSEDLIANGDFSLGFDESTGVGSSWDSFKSSGGAVSFSAENNEPYVHSGTNAQRISIQNAFETDQVGGIYQTVDVVAGETYTLTIHGQVRSLYGDVDQSGYGYRVQYAVNQSGGQNWREFTSAEWTEIPWDEVQLGSSTAEFSEHSAPITAESDQITLFIRGWNKWADPKLAEYTLDSIGLVGPAQSSVVVISSEGSETTTAADTSAASATSDDEMIDQPLPETGFGDDPNLVNDGRFWGALLVLILLAGGAVYKAKQQTS